MQEHERFHKEISRELYSTALLGALVKDSADQDQNALLLGSLGWHDSRPSSEGRSLTQWMTTVVPCSLMVLFVDALVEETRARTDVQWQMMGFKISIRSCCAARTVR